MEQDVFKTPVAQAQLESVLDTAADGCVVIDAEARILTFNKACEELFGYNSKEVYGQNVNILLPDPIAYHHDQYVSEYLLTGRKKIIGSSREVEARHKSGALIPVELSVGEARTSEGIQFIAVMRDLRPRKAAEAKYRNLQSEMLHAFRVHALDEMSAAVAHELNQPLTALMLYLQVAGNRLDPDIGDNSAVVALIDKASREVQRASDILSRIQAFVSKREVETKVMSLKDIVDDGLELGTMGFTAPGAIITKDFPDGLPSVKADPVQIQQIVVNLIRNALQAVRGRARKRVMQSMRLERDYVEFIVEDTGAGLTPEQAENIFKPFISDGKSGGMGIGLSISRTIAQTHGGYLKAACGEMGKGAKFTLGLPAVFKNDDEDTVTGDNIVALSDDNSVKK